MEIKPSCSSCVGLERCNKYCILQAGTNLVNFINGIDVVETQIGDFKTDGQTKKSSFIVSGHIMESGANPTYILSDLSTSIDASGKFNCSGDITPLRILKQYLDSLNISQEASDLAIKTFKKVNSNKLIPVPIKPGAECEITYEDSSGKKVTSASKVHMVKWLTDKKTGKIHCDVFCAVEKGMLETKYIKIPLIEYGTSIRLPQIEHTLKSVETDRELIEMTPMGFIKPIVVSDGKFTVAIDGQYLYRISEDKTFIIGIWKSGKISELHGGMEAILKSKAYKKIKTGLNYIERHKRFIVPYGLFDINKIEL